MIAMRKKVLFITMLATAMLVAENKATFVCKYCGEVFSSSSGARTGYCTYSENHKHTLSSVTDGNIFCKYCGEKFHSATGVRTGYCTKNEKNHRHCLP